MLLIADGRRSTMLVRPGRQHRRRMSAQNQTFASGIVASPFPTHLTKAFAVLKFIMSHSMLAALFLAFVALFCYVAWVRITDSRFGVARAGGRAGQISVSLPASVARVYFEIGSSVDLIIYSGTFADAHGHVLADSLQAEALARLHSWAAARRLSLDVAARRPG